MQKGLIIVNLAKKNIEKITEKIPETFEKAPKKL